MLKNSLPSLSVPKIQNLTHIARLQKSGAGEGLVRAICSAQEKLDKYAGDLARDQTKTHLEKAKLLQQSGEKLSATLLPLADGYAGNIRAKVAGYQDRVDGVLKLQGTTDVLILQNMALATADMSNSEIAALVKHDLDAARAAILLPTERYKRKLNKNPVIEAAIRDQVACNVLDNDYQDFKQASERLADAHELGMYLLKTHNACHSEFEKISASEAVAPE